MAIVKRSAIVPYTAGQMYALVNDIEAYPEFLPWCRSSKVISRDADEIHASLELAKSGLHKSFTTCNRLQADKMIEIRLVNGPFKHLEGMWRFEDLAENRSKVSLDMEFHFATRLLDMLVGPVFHQMSHSLVDAFHHRAAQVYGNK